MSLPRRCSAFTFEWNSQLVSNDNKIIKFILDLIQHLYFLCSKQYKWYASILKCTEQSKYVQLYDIPRPTPFDGGRRFEKKKQEFDWVKK